MSILGGNRWSKPHVATLSLHSLFELRSLLLNGSVILDMEATSIEQIADLAIDNMVNNNRFVALTLASSISLIYVYVGWSLQTEKRSKKLCSKGTDTSIKVISTDYLLLGRYRK